MRNRLFLWLSLIFVSAIALLFTLHYFSDGFPVVSLDLRMDRPAAISAASEVATRFELGPQPYSSSASFELDQAVQNYVELEGGGTAAFARMVGDGLYSPYRWVVRHYSQGVVEQCLFFFTPEGRPYGFRLALPETDPGAALSAEAARTIAESGSASWNLDLASFELIEESMEEQPSGRKDHAFTYERDTLAGIGEGRYRLALEVAGDRLSRVEHYVWIPEEFERRYQKMRSANNTLAFGASLALGALYLLGGCGVGIFYLLRRRAARWRPALKWGAAIGGLQFLAGINRLPLAWMNYDTALSSSNFIFQVLLESLGSACVIASLMVMTFVAAEGLTRLAFPDQLQLWRLWSPGVANSGAVAGRTVAGFLLVPVFFAYETLLYFVSSRLLGWWTPSDALIEPNALATWLPWLNPVAVSLQAGFWEECLFRAVPLSIAALLGRRHGRPKIWIASALLLQAVIFGAAHANYATQPFYARMVELILPSIGFGLLYLFYGLLPAIVLHFTFDVVWFALPLFVSQASGVLVDQSLVVLLTLLPLGVVFWQRFGRGRWESPTAEAYNYSSQPLVTGAEEPTPSSFASAPVVQGPPLSERARRLWWIGGIGGALVLPFLQVSDHVSPPLQVDRQAAIQAAQGELRRLGLPRLEERSPVAYADTDPDLALRYVWKEGGTESVRLLISRYLNPPLWEVGFLQFDGPQDERAEELWISIDARGDPWRIRHRLPEARSGPVLDREAAVRLAAQAVEERFGAIPTSLRLVSTEPAQMPARRDWIVTWADESAPVPGEGEARILVRLSGDRITDLLRFVHVPEDWVREDRSGRSLWNIVSGSCSLLLSLILLGAALIGLVKWSRGQFSIRGFLLIGGLYLALSLLGGLFRLPAAEAGFGTAQPYNHQLGTFVGITVAFSVVISLVMGLSAGWVHHLAGRSSGYRVSILTMFAVGLTCAALLSLSDVIRTPLWPAWYNFAKADSLVPLLSTALGELSRYLLRTLFALAYFGGLAAVAQRHHSRSIRLVLVAFTGLALAGVSGIEGVWSWLLSAAVLTLLVAIVYEAVCRMSLRILPVMMAVVSIIEIAGSGFSAPYPGAAGGALLGVLFVGSAALIWERAFPQIEESGPPAEEVPRSPSAN